jgi:hypothetical protein
LPQDAIGEALPYLQAHGGAVGQEVIDRNLEQDLSFELVSREIMDILEADGVAYPGVNSLIFGRACHTSHGVYGCS